MTRLVLFDLDNTLSDHSHARNCCLRMLQTRFEALSVLSLPDLARDYDASMATVHDDVLVGRVSPEEARLARLKRFLDLKGVSVGPRELTGTLDGWSETYRDNEQPVPGAKGLLRVLRDRNVGTGILTNHLARVQVRKLAHCGLEGLVDFMLTSEEARCAKPDPRIFEQALERGNARAEEAVMVGDMWDSDVAGARAAGIRAVWFNRERLPVPDSSSAVQLHSFEPVDEAAKVILGAGQRS